ncbi:hypothetical protein AU195_17750 [Mycobacterium sp. IS-1496]|uniref:hypothetical protein n=1 Tax=Mycobacterium sp. IS-1496 TaxID=1772284 RepID=UPI0007415384|nr:hypothetical protein [Mycobacterium sp. IS-1496]KUI23109.1 hypothetical protein AU195_17750 [Mycobacterium sp. IS-1496]
MTNLAGQWNVRIKTPIGTLSTTYEFVTDGDALRGSATSKDETVPLHGITVTDEPDGRRVRWRQSVTRPMRLHLDFDVLVAGDRMTGHSRAGRLPRSAVTGVRRGG